MRLALAATALVVVGGSAALAAKPTRFWNLTDHTIVSFMLAPAGTDKYGTDFAKADTDAVDHDERLKLPNVTSGTYDVMFSDDKGRKCAVKGIAIKEGDVFTIEEKQLTGCTK